MRITTVTGTPTSAIVNFVTDTGKTYGLNKANALKVETEGTKKFVILLSETFTDLHFDLDESTLINAVQYQNGDINACIQAIGILFNIEGGGSSGTPTTDTNTNFANTNLTLDNNRNHDGANHNLTVTNLAYFFFAISNGGLGYSSGYANVQHDLELRLSALKVVMINRQPNAAIVKYLGVDDLGEIFYNDPNAATWKLGGNSDLPVGSFLGTTDHKSLLFMVNSVLVGYFNKDDSDDTNQSFHVQNGLFIHSDKGLNFYDGYNRIVPKDGAFKFYGYGGRWQFIATPDNGIIVQLRDDTSTFMCNVLIGDMANKAATAALQIKSTTQGFLPPRMTEAERDAIDMSTIDGVTQEGLIIYNLTYHRYNFWNGSSWATFMYST